MWEGGAPEICQIASKLAPTVSVARIALRSIRASLAIIAGQADASRTMRIWTMKRWLAACCAAAFLAGSMTAIAAGKKRKKAAPKKLERLTCMLGTEDQHARAAVEMRGGSVQSFAYYSKWKPRTCSVHLVRGDAYSKWQDSGRMTTVTTENGSFLIENGYESVQFMFKDVNRMFYCGMEGTIKGSLTVRRGKRECVVDGVMDEQSEK